MAALAAGLVPCPAHGDLASRGLATLSVVVLVVVVRNHVDDKRQLMCLALAKELGDGLNPVLAGRQMLQPGHVSAGGEGGWPWRVSGGVVRPQLHSPLRRTDQILPGVEVDGLAVDGEAERLDPLAQPLQGAPDLGRFVSSVGRGIDVLGRVVTCPADPPDEYRCALLDGAWVGLELNAHQDASGASKPHAWLAVPEGLILSRWQGIAAIPHLSHGLAAVQAVDPRARPPPPDNLAVRHPPTRVCPWERTAFPSAALRNLERALDERFGRPTQPLTADERAALRKLRGRYNDFKAPWTLATDAERIDLIKNRWGVEAGCDVDFVYEVIQRQNNAVLHSSPMGYGLAMSPGPRQINRVGPDRRWRDALGHGVLGYYLICRVLAEEFGFDKDRAAQIFNHLGCLNKVFSDEHLASLPADALCPCESGRLVSECHAL
jgi:hypothetical protein